MRLALRLLLWTGAVALTGYGILLLSGAFDAGTDAAGRGLGHAYGFIIALIGGAALITLLLVRLWRGFLIIGIIFLALPFILMVVLSIGRSIEETHNAREVEDVHSGRWNFREQPALLAVAEAVSKNDSDAIRAAAKNVPDLNTPGRDGMTLLCFAVNEALERPELTTAVETLLSVGANPNYNNGSANSFALAQSVSGEVRLLRAMLDAGGDPNGRDVKGQPIVFDNWFMNYFEAQRPQRLRLLLDRGTDVNSIMPFNDRFTLLLYCAHMGRFEAQGYVDALELLNRGADFNYVAEDGTTLAKLLTKQRQDFAGHGEQPPPEFEKLWSRLAEHNLLPKQP
ncbi:MAG: hypothetical protein DMF03_03245 [Verrucomicrobia bacterium]|nr:MAG: hypothetical protein DMF03_03245 [Verrucomicrobiota bacterium]